MLRSFHVSQSFATVSIVTVDGAAVLVVLLLKRAAVAVVFDWRVRGTANRKHETNDVVDRRMKSALIFPSFEGLLSSTLPEILLRFSFLLFFLSFIFIYPSFLFDYVFGYWSRFLSACFDANGNKRHTSQLPATAVYADSWRDEISKNFYLNWVWQLSALRGVSRWNTNTE